MDDRKEERREDADKHRGQEEQSNAATQKQTDNMAKENTNPDQIRSAQSRTTQSGAERSISEKRNNENDI